MPTARRGFGIRVSGGTIPGNISYGNSYGILADNGVTISNNLLHDNSIAGISCVSGATVSGNVIYANGWGIQSNILFGQPASFTNNLIYGNTSGGIQLTGGYNTPITNNTIYQTTGDAFSLLPQENQFNVVSSQQHPLGRQRL